MVFVNLGSHSLQELFLFPTLVFHFLFDEFDKFATVFRMGRKYFPLCGFFFGEGFGGDGCVFCELVDFFEDAGLEFLVVLILDEFELSSKEADLFFVPLEGAVDVFVEFEGRVLGVVLVGLSE